VSAGAAVEPSGAQAAGGGTVVVASTLAPRDVFRASATLMLRHRLAYMAMAAGPVFWLVGTVSASPEVVRVAMLFLLLTAGVPLFALLVASYSAYRPGSKDLYVEAQWSFSDTGIDIVQPERRARAEWSDFASWRSTRESYILDVKRSRYLVFPRRDVAEGDRQAFEALLRAELGARRG